MSTHQFVRIELRENLSGGLYRHIRGDTRPPQSRPRPGLERVTVLRELPPAVAERIFAVASQRTKRKAGTAIEVLFSGPPPYEPDPEWDAKRRRQWDRDRAAWPQERIEAWARDCIAWWERRAPKAAVVLAALHADETSAHVHLAAYPITSQGNFSSTRLQAEIGSGAGALCPRRDELSDCGRRLQARFQADVGRHYGLTEGLGGFEHEPLTDTKRWRRYARRLEAELDRADARLGLLERALHWAHARLPVRARARLGQWASARLGIPLAAADGGDSNPANTAPPAPGETAGTGPTQ